MNKKLRRYQERAVDAFDKWYEEKPKSKDINDRLATIILAMGLGKTYTAAFCINNVLQKSNQKILWCAHREELIDQAYSELKEIITVDADIQIEMSDRYASSDSDIVVGSVQTLCRTRKDMTEFEPDLIIIDEFHHYHKDNVQYHGLVEKYPNAKILGLTATPYRFSGGDLPLGKQLINVDIGLGIRHGYLIKPKAEVLNSKVSLAGVKSRAGDFAIDELSDAINTKDRNDLIVNRLVKAVKEEGRKGILYAASVSHAKSLADLLRANNISVAEIYGETPKEERRELMQKIHNKEIDITVNNLVLTEGTNIPHINLICMARPTKSMGLYYQVIGRGLRLYENKKDCLIIDVFDMVKATQSVINFKKVANVGDIDGSRKRAEYIMKEKVADKLEHFPVVMKLDKECWELDNTTWFSSAWMLDTNQWVITWSKRTERQKTDSFTWEPIKYTPKKSALKSKPMYIRHKEHGEGIVNDITYGAIDHLLSVTFNSGDIINVPLTALEQRIEKYEQKKLQSIIKRAFYIVTNDNKSYCRLIVLIQDGNHFKVQSDVKGDFDTVNEVIRAFANEDDMAQIVNKSAKWKARDASDKQKWFVKNLIKAGKLENNIDVDSLSGGDASALMDQADWKPIINNLFGANKIQELIGYLKESDDI